MVALEQESTQLHGVVFVTVPGDPKTEAFQDLIKSFTYLTGIPCRRIANHICLWNNELNPILKMMLPAVTREFRLRLRIHMEGKFRTSNNPTPKQVVHSKLL